MDQVMVDPARAIMMRAIYIDSTAPKFLAMQVDKHIGAGCMAFFTSCREVSHRLVTFEWTWPRPMIIHGCSYTAAACSIAADR